VVWSPASGGISTPAVHGRPKGPAPARAGREHGVALARATGPAVLVPGNSGFVPIGVAGVRNVNDQLPLHDAFAYRPWPLHAFEEPTMTEELRWP
jgi:hypothetical protein